MALVADHKNWLEGLLGPRVRKLAWTRRLTVVLSVWLAYVWAFLALYREGPSPAYLLVIVPLAVSGVLFGLRGGVIGWAGHICLNMFLVSLLGRPASAIFFERPGGVWAGLAIALVIGLMSDAGVAWSDALEKVRLSEEKYRRLFQTISDAAIIFDAETNRIVDANQATLDLFGYTRDEFLNLKVADISAEREKTEVAIRDVVAGRLTRVPLRYKRKKDGTVFPVEIAAGTFESSAGKLMLAALRDLTDIKRAQQRIVLAQEQERKRIARELHDEVNSSLGAVLIELGAFDQCNEIRPGRLVALRERLREVMEALATAARGLHPSTLEDLGLSSAVEQLTQEFQRVHGIGADLVVHGFDARIRLSPVVELALYRIVQEALTNIGKHAKASSVSIVLERRADEVRLVVEDNGCGFELDPVNGGEVGSAGLGLHNMRDRVALLCGMFAVETGRGRGCSVHVTVPCEVLPVVPETSKT